MRVNLGCGDRYAHGWLNIDHAGSPHRKDLEWDLASGAPLPWSAGSVTHVYAGHVLEHLSVETCHVLLAQLLPCMAPGGQIMVVGPDILVAEAMIADGTFDFRYGHTLESLRFGGNRWPGDAHLWECDAVLVSMMLAESGWQDVTSMDIRDVPELWPVADRAPLWQCAVTGVAPSTNGEGS